MVKINTAPGTSTGSQDLGQLVQRGSLLPIISGEVLDDLVLGRNFIKKVGEGTQSDMLEKNVERLVKGPSGEAELKAVDDISGVLIVTAGGVTSLGPPVGDPT